MQGPSGKTLWHSKQGLLWLQKYVWGWSLYHNDSDISYDPIASFTWPRVKYSFIAWRKIWRLLNPKAGTIKNGVVIQVGNKALWLFFFDLYYCKSGFRRKLGVETTDRNTCIRSHSATVSFPSKKLKF